MQQPATVELQNIAKSHGRRRLFAHISAQVAPGECLTITGANGAGKSTLLKIIAGLMRPSAGRVVLRDAERELQAAQGRVLLGMVSPEMMLYQAMTGWENARFICDVRGAAVSAQALQTCFRTVGLAGREKDAVGTYSTGMRQRLKFAILLALAPPVWLLDEPSANLDAAGKRLVAGLISIALARRVTVALATNEVEETHYAGPRIHLG